MNKKKKKRLIWIGTAVGALVVILFVLNTVFLKKLEQLIEEELVEQTGKATDGFYQLSIEDVSILFLQSRLKISGVSLHPDTAVFRQWALMDSLPSVYLSATVDAVDFRGINFFLKKRITNLHFSTFEINSPHVEVTHNVPEVKEEKEEPRNPAPSFFRVISPYLATLDVSKMNLNDASFQYRMNEKEDTTHYELSNLTIRAREFRLDSDEESMKLKSFSIDPSEIKLSKQNRENQYFHVRFDNLAGEDILRNLSGYQLGHLNIKMNSVFSLNDTIKNDMVRDSSHLTVSGLKTDIHFREYTYDNIDMSTSGITLPVSGGFYTLHIGKLEMADNNIFLDSLHYQSTYPKMEFSYKHPKHSDWFDIVVGRLEMKNVNMDALFKEKTLRMEEAYVGDMVLQNLKNQKIRLPRRIVPMVYESIQKAPIGLDIGMVEVSNFSVIYEELAQEGVYPGKLSITDLNGTITGLTNIVTEPEQFIRLDAEAKFMGIGDFTAVWLIPVDSLHDQFLLHAHLPSFNLVHLNPFIQPLADVKVESGYVYNFTVDMDANTRTGAIRMTLPYRDLKINLLKREDGRTAKRSFPSFLVNTAIRTSNPTFPDDPDSKLRHSQLTITRNPYHSTFNYFWQMLRPGFAEAVGIPEANQKFGKGVARVFKDIKSFFSKPLPSKKEDKK